MPLICVTTTVPDAHMPLGAVVQLVRSSHRPRDSGGPGLGRRKGLGAWRPRAVDLGRAAFLGFYK
jgi:hypothetical protein